MNVGDIIIAKVVAIGANQDSFMFPADQRSVKPIIVEERLRLNRQYRIEIIRDASTFYIAKVVGQIADEADDSI